ncbi:MAG: XRE family transcriptional regulator [Oscillospiraceae bacterium]|nr:XRE family transcriptional regulator [Oscillospiraceae bacterium]
MGRDATKAAGNPWYEARMKASKYNGKLASREGAAEMLGMSVSAVADAELGLTKFMPVEKAVLMADLYNDPRLLNYFCLHECPIGCRHCISDQANAIDRMAVKLVKGLRADDIEKVKDTILDIAEDGKVGDDEKESFRSVLSYLEKLGKLISEIKIIGDQVLKEENDE